MRLVTPLIGFRSVPPAVLQRFGSLGARPRVDRIYTPLGGFQRVRPRVVLTTEVALRLREQGVSTVELVWHRHRHTMTLTADWQSVWGQAPVEAMAELLALSGADRRSSVAPSVA